MTSIDGQVIAFKDIASIPYRSAFLNSESVAKCRSQLDENETVEFLPVHIWETYLPEKYGKLSQEEYSFRMYKIAMFGILRSGEKVTVIQDGILPFIELAVPRTTGNRKKQADAFEEKCIMECRARGFKLKETKIVSGATIKEYGDYTDFIQLCFSSLNERKKAIDWFEDQKYETSHDDATCYYRMVSRDQLTPWTSWLTLEKYKVVTDHPFFKTELTICINYKNIKEYKGDIFADEELRRDKTIEVSFDLETRDPEQVDDIPYPYSPTAEMPNISLAFNFIDSDLFPASKCDPNDAEYVFSKPKGHLLQYNITTMMTLPIPNRITIMCKNMDEQIMAVGLVWSSIKPEYAVGFNTDRYDWLWLGEKARQLKLLPFLERTMSCANIEAYREFEGKIFENPTSPFVAETPAGNNHWGSYPYWKKYQFKISAELQNYTAACLNYPGYVCIDLLPQLRAQCNNPEKYSLHRFLEIFQLGDKVEMPYKVMFRRFTRNKALLSQMQSGYVSEDITVNKLKVLSWGEIERCAKEIDTAKITAGLSTVIDLPDDNGVLYKIETFWKAVQIVAKEMVSVAEYCIVDSERCHDLLFKTQFIRDKRQVGILSYTTMDDCVYRANGMKVRNMIIAKAQSRNYHVSNRAPKHIEIGKYPGAYVFPPYKGIATAKPSPHEMRYGTKSENGIFVKDPKYQVWQNMPEIEFEKCLEHIRKSGIWLEDYLPASKDGKIPTSFPDRSIMAEIYKARYKSMKNVAETPEEFAIRYEAIIITKWNILYKQRYNEQCKGESFEDWLANFQGDLSGEVPAAFIEWLLTDSHYPIAGLDFSSLYPSLIMTYNFSPEMMVHSLERALDLMVKGKKIHPVNFPFNGRTIKGWSVRSSYPEYQDKITAVIEKAQTLVKSDDINGLEEMRLAKKLEELLVLSEFGLFPTVLKDLFDQRVALKSHLKPLTNKIEEFNLMSATDFTLHHEQYSIIIGKWNYINSKQRALKVFMNTFYGESGNAMSPLRVLALAGGVTSGGQYNIKKVAQLVAALGCRIYYGDSVTGDTPVLLKIVKCGNDVLTMTTFDKITTWSKTQTEKELSEAWNSHWIWTATGWARIRSVVRHQTEKRIYRVSTATGIVDVTEDHSLLSPGGVEIKPNELKIGETKLMHGSPIYVSHNNQKYDITSSMEDVNEMSKNDCFAFLAGNSRYKHQGLSIQKYMSINGWRIDIDIVIQNVINGTPQEKMYFLMGVLHGTRPHQNQSDSSLVASVPYKCKIDAAIISHISRELGYGCLVESDSVNIYKSAVIDFTVKKISEVNSQLQWVYDITTDDGTFAAGIGDLIIKNTDSVYISMPREAFASEDRRYYSIPHSEWSEASKIEYFSGVVMESFRQIKIINLSVNDALEADNGTKFLNMAFEEFLYPAAFFSKKKYCGIAHEKTFNPNPKEIFVRGLEYIKKGTSEMLKDLSKSILWETFSKNNIDTIFTIVERKIEAIYTARNIEFEKFVKTASYKPNKKNVAVHTFHRRMEALGIAPEPMDRFRYVIVKKYPFKYDVKGRKTALSVGDRMEYADRAQALNMEIDLDYYMLSNVCGQLARFISWHPDFDITPRDDTDDAYTEAEKKNIGAASKYIEKCYDKWSEKHVSKGPALRTLYKKVNTVFHDEFNQIMRVSNLWQIESQTDKLQEDENQNIFDIIKIKIEKQTNMESRKDAERMIARMHELHGTDIHPVIDKRNCYKDILKSRRDFASKTIQPLHSIMQSHIKQLRKLFVKRDDILEQCISGLSREVGCNTEDFDSLELIIERINSLDTSQIRKDITSEIGAKVTHQDLLLLSKIDDIYIKCLGIHKLIRTTELVTDELNSYIHFKLGGEISHANDLDDIDEWMNDNMN